MSKKEQDPDVKALALRVLQGDLEKEEEMQIDTRLLNEGVVGRVAESVARLTQALQGWLDGPTGGPFFFFFYILSSSFLLCYHLMSVKRIQLVPGKKWGLSRLWKNWRISSPFLTSPPAAVFPPNRTEGQRGTAQL